MEESKAHEQEIRDYDRKLDAALKVVEPIRKEHCGKDWAGILECPICKGKLHVRHHGYNNHVHAKCETDDCVGWLE